MLTVPTPRTSSQGLYPVDTFPNSVGAGQVRETSGQRSGPCVRDRPSAAAPGGRGGHTFPVAPLCLWVTRPLGNTRHPSWHPSPCRRELPEGAAGVASSGKAISSRPCAAARPPQPQLCKHSQPSLCASVGANKQLRGLGQAAPGGTRVGCGFVW